MNYTTAVFLINESTRAVAATYEDHQRPTIFKTLDQSIKVDDYVVVPTDTRHKMTVCKVTAVDVSIDYDSPIPVAWVISVVDSPGYAKLIQQEQQAIDVVRSAEHRKKREELRASMLANSMDEIKALPIAHTNEVETK